MDGATVPVAIVPTRIEAELIVGLLATHGVHAIIVADDAGGQQPQWQVRGVRVLVASDDEATARQILDTAPGKGLS
jgi:hypothetical protein